MKEYIDYGFNEKRLFVVPVEDDPDAEDGQCHLCACTHLSDTCKRMQCSYADRPDKRNIHWIAPVVEVGDFIKRQIL